MNAQRLTLVTIVLAVLVVLAAVVVPRLTTGTKTTTAIDYAKQPHAGDPQAPAKIAVFFDFLCPHCASFSEEIAPAIMRELVDTGMASLYYLNLPVIDPAGRSRDLAILGECVYQQNNAAFFTVEPILMRSQGEIARNTSRALDLAIEYAPELSAEQLRSCVATRATAAAVTSDEEVARQAQLTGTPSVLVNGSLVSNPTLANIRRAVEAATK